MKFGGNLLQYCSLLSTVHRHYIIATVSVRMLWSNSAYTTIAKLLKFILVIYRYNGLEKVESEVSEKTEAT